MRLIKNFVVFKFVILLLLCPYIAAQEEDFWTEPFWVGLGLEGQQANQHKTTVSFGGAFSAGSRINRYFGLGLKAVAAYNFNDLLTVEPEVFMRWYFLHTRIGAFSTELFAQGDVGLEMFRLDSGSTYRFVNGARKWTEGMGGATAGARFRDGSFYIEPYVRFSYPLGFGVGLSAGFSFQGSSIVGTKRARAEKRAEAEARAIRKTLEAAEGTSAPKVIVDGEDVKIDLEIYFEPDRAQMLSGEERKLDYLVPILNKFHGRIMVAGHAASTNNEEGELEVSTLRSQTVANYFAGHTNHKPQDFVLWSYGSTRAADTDEAGKQINRMVEITLLHD